MMTASLMAEKIAALDASASFTAYTRGDGTEVRVTPHRSASSGRVWYSVIACRDGHALSKKQVAYQPGAAAKKARALVTRLQAGAWTEAKAKTTTTVDIVIRLEVAGCPADVAKHRGALRCLADVMRVQAEDGLWSLGHEGGENDEGPSEYVADIERALVQTVAIDGVDELTKEAP